MAINYEKVGWDTTKYFNPTNMNHMDDGIKAACDKADANEAAIADVNSNLVEEKMLGWTVPSECPAQNYVDGDGIFHQRVGRVDLGTLDWSYNSEYKRFSTSGITDYKKKDSASNMWVANAFLKGYRTTSGNYTASDSYNKSIGFNGTSNMFFVKNTSYTDTTTFKNAMQGQYLYYELATEISMNVDGNEAVTSINRNLQTTIDSLLYKYENTHVTKNSTHVMRCNKGYASFIIIGFMQNVGMYQLLITSQGGEINVLPIIDTVQNTGAKEKITAVYSNNCLLMTFSEESNFIMLGTDTDLR